DGQQHRDDHRELVRPEECDQPQERRAVPRHCWFVHLLNGSRASSARIASAASTTRARLAGSFSQPLAPDGCGSGIAVTPSYEYRPPTASVTLRTPSNRRAANPPTV